MALDALVPYEIYRQNLMTIIKLQQQNSFKTNLDNDGYSPVLVIDELISNYELITTLERLNIKY